MTDMTRVDSSLISEIGYNVGKEELRVRFKKGGAEYVYLKVPPPVFTAMQEAVSLGSFFLRNVKGQYETRKVEDEAKGGGEKREGISRPKGRAGADHQPE